MTALRCAWNVTAGMILGVVDEKHTRSFSIDSAEWGATENKIMLLMQRSHAAAGYAAALQIASASGCEPNWVNIEFIWM